MATANASAVEAAKAVNALLGLSSNDQGALLEVLEDYFSSPDPEKREDDELDEDSDEDDEVDDGLEALLEGTLTIALTLLLLLLLLLIPSLLYIEFINIEIYQIHE